MTNIDKANESLAEVKTTCPYCGVGCGVIAKKDEDGAWRTTGDSDHPANFGRLCSKGSALEETLDLEGRIIYPQVSGVKSTWGNAIDTIAQEFKKVADEYGPESIAFYLSGQMLTEDYYVANKLAKGFIGTPHVDTNSRLCMASSVVGHKRAFGSDTVPNSYEDLDTADVITLVGSNAAWCHPVLFQRMLANKNERGAKIVCIDVRHTATSEDADLNLIIKPGTDAYLFNGLLTYLSDKNKIDYQYVTEHCEGFEKTAITARETAPNAEFVAKKTGLKVSQVTAFYELFAETEKTITCYSQGINQSSSGANKVNAIVNCHLATGRIGKEGAGPFSLTGQPNAMGGREVGGLANQLAAHMDFDDASLDRVGRFWNAKQMITGEGLKAVDMFDALYAGRIKAIWIMCTNPAVSLPRAGKIGEALANAEFVVVSDCVENTDTMKYAHVKLPASSWGEKSGTVTNSERCISRQRSFLKSPGEAKPDWWAMCEVAKAMGFENEFSYDGPAAIFDEHAKLSAFENNGTRDFNLSGMKDLSTQEYDAIEPVQWPVFNTLTGATGTQRLFAEGHFYRPGNKANLLPITPELPRQKSSKDYPIILNTGRVRDHWHTMTRTAKSPRLSTHRSEPFVEINPADARRFDLRNGSLARVKSIHGEALMRVRVDEGQTKGLAFAPIHWSGANTGCGRVSDLIAGHCDPFSGQPESKYMPISLEPAKFSKSAILLTRSELDVSNMPYWARWRTGNAHVFAMGMSELPQNNLADWLRDKYQARSVNFDNLIEYTDPIRGDHRVALFTDGKLEAVLALRETEELIASETLDALFEPESFEPAKRRAVLSLKPLDGMADKGPTICACFSVGLKQITEVIATGQAASADEVGQLLKAGTNCGSCLPEIRKLVDNQAVGIAAE